MAIALGANLPSLAGPPSDTLLAIRPRLETALKRWLHDALGMEPSTGLRLVWSPLHQTSPVGGPPGQADFLNGALLVELPEALAMACAQPKAASPWVESALVLLRALQQLEADFGRPALNQRAHWGPRCLDLDWLWWGRLTMDVPASASTPALKLPHPLWRERTFVLTPLQSLIGAPCLMHDSPLFPLAG